MSQATFECRVEVFGAEERARYSALRKAMSAAVRELQELPDGYAARLPSDPAVFRDVAEWIALERRCCPFLTLGLDWRDSNAVWLRLTGGPGVKAFLSEWVARRS